MKIQYYQKRKSPECWVTKNEGALETAIQSLLEIDRWRSSIELSKIASYLRLSIESYFEIKDFTFHIPGRIVFIRNYPVDLRMVLISVGKSDP